MRSGTIAFLFGIVLLQQLSVLPGPRWLWLLVLVPLAWRPARLRWLTLLVAGFLWALLHALLVLESTLPAQAEGVDLILEGRVTSIPELRERALRFNVQVDRLSRDGKEVGAPRKVRLAWYGRSPPIQAGELWRLTVRLKRPSGFMNPGGFDYEGWLHQRGITATGYVRDSIANVRLDEAAGMHRLQALRQAIADRLQTILGQSEFRGILIALAMGERSDISPEQWQVLRKTGTNHLVAISGLHIGLVAGLVFLVAGWLWSRSQRLTSAWPAAKAAACFALLAALAYAALAGFSIPTRRALIMLCVAMGAVILQRNSQPSRTLAWALLLVLLLDPLSVLDAGFWLSFGAVAVILYGMLGRLGTKGLWWKWGRVQWIVSIGLLPLSLVFFQSASLASPLANLLAVPWVGFLVVPPVLLGTALLPFGDPASTWLLQMADYLFGLFWHYLEWLSAQPFSAWQQHAPTPWALGAAVFGIALLLAPRGLPGRPLGFALLLPALLTVPTPPPPQGLHLTLLDVGQGLAAVVRTRSHVLVYDTGPRFSDAFDTGDAVVVPYLRQMGLNRIDRLIISHGDNDHIGGLRSVVRQLPVGTILTGVPEKMGDIPAVLCAGAEPWEWDGVRFEIIHPPQESSFTGNDRSCVLRVQAGAESVLLTGDIHERSERSLIERRPESLPAAVLVVPHHGSATSSSLDFIRAVAPRYALFPLGYRNRFGFPKAKVTERFRQEGIRMLDSARHGAISFALDPTSGLGPPNAYRESARRYWHRK